MAGDNAFLAAVVPSNDANSPLLTGFETDISVGIGRNNPLGLSLESDALVVDEQTRGLEVSGDIFVVPLNDLSSPNSLVQSTPLIVPLDGGSQPLTVNVDQVTGLVDGSPSTNPILEALKGQVDPLYGDADFDDDVDDDDLAAVLKARNTLVTDPDGRQDLDGDGRITTLDARKLIVYLQSNTDFDAPDLDVALTQDTAPGGTINSDGITFELGITGTAFDSSLVTRLRAGVDDTPVENFVDILGARQADGSFSLNREQLEAIYGAPLADGEHRFRLWAKDQWANQTDIVELAFTVDTVAPPLTLDLDPAFDTGELGDQQTELETVTLVGQTEPSLSVTLEETGDSTTADATGQFSFTTIALQEGANTFTVRTADVAGNETVFTQVITRVVVNTPPTVDPDKSLTVQEDNVTSLAIGAPTDIDNDALTITVTTIPDVTKGELQLSDGTPVVTGQNLTAEELTQLVFSPVENATGEAGNFSYTVDDGQGGSASQTVALTIAPVNDAPVITVPTVDPVEAGTELTISGIAVSDVDAGEAQLEVTVSAVNGVLTLGQLDGLTFLTGDGLEDNTLIFTGTLAAINGALGSLVYQSDATFSGTETISLVVDDQGNSGEGGSLSDAATIAVTVNPPDGILLVEEDNFNTNDEFSFAVPVEPAVLSFTYQDLNFDSADLNAINDAFEVALVDAAGNSLIHTIGGSRDAFLNVTEGLDVVTAAGVSVEGTVVTVNLAGITPGTEAKLLMRLVNNDSDTETAVRIADINVVETPGLAPPGGVTPDLAILSSDTVVDFEKLSDVSASLVADYGRTSFNEETDTLLAGVTVRNAGQYGVDGPIVVAVDNLSDPTVQVVNADGVTPEGLPYYLLSEAVLAPGTTTSLGTTLEFVNSGGEQFTYDLVFLGHLNEAPEIITEPNLEGSIGKPYRYDVDATDPEGDPVTYSLLLAPEGMTIDSETGVIEWDPQEVDRGTQSITVQAADGRGGLTEQTFDLVVDDAPPNRPPVFTTGPVVDARVNTVYEYDADATDLDRDELTYALVNGPEGMTVDSTTGLVSWTPTAEQILSEKETTAPELTLPVIDGFTVEEYAKVTDPLELSFDQAGNLFVSRDQIGTFATPRSTPFPDVKIHRVSPGGEVVEEYGNQAFPDPDTVTFDQYGNITGLPNSVLVGGLTQDGNEGLVQAILPDQSVTTILAPSAFNENVTNLTIDSSGRLLFHTNPPSAAGSNSVIRVEAGVATKLLQHPVDIRQIALDDQNRIYVSGVDGVISLYDPDGQVIDPVFATGLGSEPSMVFGTGGFWGTNLYVLNHDTDELIQLDTSGSSQVVATGLNVTNGGLPSFRNLAFGPDNALYVSDFENDRILRVAPNRETLGLAPSEHSVTITVADGKGGVAVQNYVVNVLPEEGNHEPVIVSEPVTQVLLTAPEKSSLDGVIFGIKTKALANISSTTPAQLFSLTSDQSNTFKDIGAVQLDGISIDVDGLAISPHFGLLGFEVSNLGSRLISLNTETAEATATGSVLDNRDIRGAVFDAFDRLWALDALNDTLLQINPNNGGILEEKTLTLDDAAFDVLDYVDLAVHPDGSFYLFQANENYTLDISTGEVALEYIDTTQQPVFGGILAPQAIAGAAFTPFIDSNKLVTYDINGTDDVYSYDLDSDYTRETLYPNILPSFNAGRGDLASIVVPANVYRYDVEAIDPDNDTLTYSLVEAPEDMVIAPDTGEISWNAVSSPFVVKEFNFDTGELPSADEDTAYVSNQAINTFPSVNISETDAYSVEDGILSQRTLNRIGYAGYQSETDPGFDPTLDLVVEARLRVQDILGDRNTGFYVFDGLNVYNILLEDEGMKHITPGGESELVPFDVDIGGAYHTYRLESEGNSSEFDFFVDGKKIYTGTAGEAFASLYNNSLNNWSFGDGSSGLDNDANVDWDYIRFLQVDNSADVTVRVEDGRGGSDEQSFRVQLVEAPDVDLTIDEVTPSNLAVNGQTLALTGSASAKITNQDSDDLTQPFDVLFFEDANTNQTYDEGIDNILGSTTVTDPLAAGSTQTVTADLAGTISFLGVPIWGFVDSGNAVNETDETNNLAFSSHDCIAQSGEFNPVVEWNKQAFTVEPTSNQVLMTPVVIDVNNDNISDVIFSTYDGNDVRDNGKLRAISGADGSEIWTITNPNYEVHPINDIATGDIDNDGLPEIIAVAETLPTGSQDSATLIAFEHDGTFKWRSEAFLQRATEELVAGLPSYGGIAISDLNQDGSPEIVVGATALDSEGNILWQGNLGQGSTGFGPLSTIADLDLDGMPEVIAGNTAYRADGSIYWNQPLEDGFTALGNFDEDLNPEIVLVTQGKMHLLEHTGDVKWGDIAISGDRAGAPTVADMDGDGEPEIGVAGTEDYVVFETDGTVKWRSPIQEFSAVTGSTVFDFDGDGSAEVVYGDELFLRIYDGTSGEVLNELPKSSVTAYELPVIADVDADGNAEIIAVANTSFGVGPQNGIFVIGDRNDTWVSTRQIWNQHSYHITNINDDGTIPIQEDNSWQVHNTYRLNAFPEGEGNALAAPDLVPSYVRLEDTDTETTITARIGNGGAQFVAGGVKVAFYNGDPRNGGLLLGTTQTINRIDIGAFEDVRLTVPVGIATLEDIWVVADDDGTGQGFVNECDEENNFYNVGLALANQPPEFTTDPIVDAFVNTSYIYDSDAIDLNKDELTFALVDGPEGMEIDTKTGVLTWTASSETLSGRRISTVTSTLPIIPGFDVKTYADVTDPFEISFDPAGKLYVGRDNSGSGGSTFDAVHIHQISPGGKVFQEYGDSVIDDPDTVFFDNEGHFSDIPGTVLVGGHNTAGLGRISAIYPDETTEVLFGPSVELGNIGSMVSDSTGRLLFIYAGTPEIWAVEDNVPLLLFSSSAPVFDITVDSQNHIYAATDNGIQVYSSDGQLLDEAFGDIFESYSALKFGTGGFWGTDLYAFHNDSNELHHFDQDGNRQVFATNFSQNSVRGITFGPDDAMYVSDFVNDRILHIAPNQETLGLDSNQYPVTITVADGQGGVDVQNYIINVKEPPTNSEPEFTSIPVDQAYVVQSFRYDASAQDADGDVLTYDLSLAPEGMGIDPNTGIVVWEPTIDQIGTHDVILRVQDGNGGVDLQAFQIEVSNNSAPVITSLPFGPTIASTLYQYDVDAEDADGDELTYSLLANPGGVSIDENSGLLTWTPTDSDVGDNFIRVQVADGEGGIDTQSFTLPVIAAGAANNRPVINNSPRDAIGLGDDYVFQVEATDPDNDPLTYSLTDAPVGMTIDGNGLVVWPAEQTQLGEYSFTVKVEDGRGAVVEAPYTVNVVQQTVNGTPTITSTPSFVAIIGDQYIYEAQATDPDNDPIAWSLVSGPVGLTLDETTGRVSWTPTEDQFGFHEVIIDAIDAQGASSRQGFGINVSSTNAPPLITSAPPTLAFADTAYTYAIQASDSNGDALTYSLSVAPVGMTIDETTGLIEWTPTAAQLGTQAVTVSVADGRGGFVEQRYTLNVASDVPNQPPSITSTPGFNAIAEELYTYQIEAVDPENLALSYDLLSGPTGMSVDSSTGLLTWTPTLDQVGPHTVKVTAADPLGLAAVRTFTLTVGEDNQNPVLKNTPGTTALIGDTYAFDLNVTDPDGDAVTYTLVNGPEGMTIDALGRLRWTPTAEDVGTERIDLLVEDGRGGNVTFGYDLSVVADTTAPQVALTVSADPVNVNDSVIVQVNAVDDVAIDEIGLAVDGTPVALDSNGTTTLSFEAIGSVELVATALDTSGNEASTDFSLAVVDTSDVTAPLVSFIRLEDPSDPGTALIDQITKRPFVTSFADIIGTVDDPDDNLTSFTLTATPFAGGPTTVLAEGTSEVIGDVLGEFDSTLLRNDSYILELSAVDAGGNTASTSTLVDVEGDLKVGNYTLSFVDLSIPLTGIPIVVSRTYDTLNANVTDDFGYGWSMDLRDTDLTDNVGESGLEDSGIYNAFFDGAAVYVTLPNGEREKFIFQPQARGLFGLTTYKPRFVAADGDNTSTLTVDDIDLQRTVDGRYVTLSQIPYNPASTLISGTSSGNYTLTTKDGIKYTIDGDSGDLETVTDRNGNTLTYTEGGVFSSTGKQVTFERDPQGRITAIIDPEGNRITYEYDALGDLVAVTDREDNKTQFTYGEDIPHFLDDMIDPLGRTGVRSDYNEEGRLVRLLDVNGNPTEIIYDTGNLVETVRDALGNETIFIRDNHGNPITEINAEGEITKRLFDTNDNLISEVNPLGHTTTYTYDVFNNLVTTTNSLGNITQYTYNSFGLIETVTNELGSTQALIYDGNGNLISIEDPLGAIKKIDYDSSGNPIKVTDPKGNSSQFDFDSFGYLESYTDQLGNITNYTYDKNGNRLSITSLINDSSGLRELAVSYEYDANGNLTVTTDSKNSVRKQEYDANHNLSVFVDARGNSTIYKYDERGLLTQIVDPEGFINTYEYDVLGRMVKHIDELGRETHLVYDKLGQVLERIMPDETPLDLSDNPRIHNEYDAIGNLIAEVDANGNRTEFEYDALGQQTILRDPLGNKISFSYDKAGRQIEQVDKLGNATQFVYDAVGQRAKTIFADGTTSLSKYDLLGNLVEEIDPRGHTTSYNFNEVGNLESIKDSLSNIRRIEYNQLGLLESDISPNGVTTNYEYDDAGRLTDIENSSGEKLSIFYDEEGNVISATSYSGSGVESEYNSNHQVTHRQFDDGTTELFEYDQEGRLITHTNRLGNASTFIYDNQDRVIEIRDALGHSQLKEYDQAGNLTLEVNALGHKTTYEYDELNRLRSITDSNNGITGYTYDKNGNISTITDPSGNTTTFAYDELNHLVSETNELGRVRTFSYDELGNLIRKTDRNGRVSTFEYDSLNRLAVEHWLEGDSIVHTLNYSYTSDGLLETTSDVNSSYSYVYDDDNYLITTDIDISGNSSTISLGQEHDDSGRRVGLETRIDGQKNFSNTYQYDPFDRVVQIEQIVNSSDTLSPEKRIEFTYDPFDQINNISRYSGQSSTDLVASTTHTQDQLGRLTSIIHSDESGVISQYEYDYNNVHQVEEFRTPDGTSLYSYNNSGQLIEASHSFQPDESYSYDLNGNRTNNGYIIGPNNQVLSDGIYEYQYDAEGNRIKRENIFSGEVFEYKWDHRNRLIELISKDLPGNFNGQVQYIYDAEDRRIAKLVDPDGNGPASIEEERFIYDGENIILVFNEDGVLKNRYLHGPETDQVLAEEHLNSSRNIDSVYWNLADHQGSIRDLINSNGNVINHLVYDSFGEITNQTSPNIETRYQFTGREFDSETSQYFYRARYYDPVNGRFISEDPIGFDAGDTNLFRYVSNDPVNFIDPSGTSGTAVLVLPTLEVGAIVSGLTALSASVATAAQAYAGGAAVGISAFLIGDFLLGVGTGESIIMPERIFEVGRQIGAGTSALAENAQLALARTLRILESEVAELVTTTALSALSIDRGLQSFCQAYNPPNNPRSFWYVEPVYGDRIPFLRFDKVASPIPKGTKATDEARAFVRRHGRGAAGGDDAGHLQAKSLGGLGSINQPWPNIVPQNYLLNQITQRVFEGAIRNSVETSKRSRCLIVNPVYTGLPPYPNRPSLINYTVVNPDPRAIPSFLPFPIPNP